MPIIENKLITTTPWKEGDKPKDALGMCNGMHWDIKNCIIDLTDWPAYKTDEACGITWGSSARFENCLIRGAGKLILCGCGDDEWVDKERGKHVEFHKCVFENFGRRAPEVQDGMTCAMYDCLIQGWGFYEKFDTRVFAAWAHKGGSIYAEKCVFLPQYSVRPWYWLKDHWNHFWQCVNERGFFRALFHRDAWLSGYKRALTAGPDGVVKAVNCYAPRGYVIDNHEKPMDAMIAMVKYHELTGMAEKLREELAEK